MLRLLDLADPVKDQVNKGLLDMGHARALLALIRHDQIEIAKLVINRGLSVRETEALVKQALNKGSSKPVANTEQIDPDIRRLQNDLSERFGAAVKIKTAKNGSGQLIINFHNSDELEGILGHMAS